MREEHFDYVRKVSLKYEPMHQSSPINGPDLVLFLTV